MIPGLALVSVTQVPEELFAEATYLGRSLKRIPEELLPSLSLACSNTGANARGLSEIFNLVLEQASPDVNVVFVHDDVYLNDWFFARRVLEALEHYDIVGLAGSASPDLSQPSWGLRFDAELNPLGWQPDARRSGIVNHFDYACPNLSVYGPTPQSCVLLDGVFLAVKMAAVKEHGVRFDPRFRFHCYDIDFCRSAAEKGLRLGTWPIAVTHDSSGSWTSPEFKQAARAYLDKWAAKTRAE
jgi:GT2 family glycosyltransferase